MARKPEVFARSLEPQEAQRLVKITRSTRESGAAATVRDRAGLVAGPVRG
ncbi:hypothetical protein [Amycolatopsis panacis]|nr:hypothetical protein [Amycolatopsis panacis]